MNKLIKPICKDCAKAFKLTLCESGCFGGMKCSNCEEEKDLYSISLDSNQAELNKYLIN